MKTTHSPIVMVMLWVLFLPLTTIAQNLSQYNRCVIIWGHNVMRLLFRCLEVIDRLDAAYDFGGGSDIFNDFVYAFISHRRLIKCIRNDAGGKDACHILLVFFHSQTLKRGGTGHQTARAVRCGAVPVFVALADANEGAVAHIDVNEQLLADLLA